MKTFKCFAYFFIVPKYNLCQYADIRLPEIRVPVDQRTIQAGINACKKMVTRS